MTFNRFAGLGTLPALRNARFSLAHRLAATFPGAGNASRKPETTVTEATTAGRGDNCGVVHNVRGRVGPRGRSDVLPSSHASTGSTYGRRTRSNRPSRPC